MKIKSQGSWNGKSALSVSYLMLVATLAILLALPSEPIELKTVSGLIDRSCRAAGWTHSAWTELARRRETDLTAHLSYRNELLGSIKVRKYLQERPRKSGPPKESIALVFKELSCEQGNGWWVWLIDFTDSRRDAVTNKPVYSFAMLSFSYKDISGEISVRSAENRPYLAADHKRTLEFLQEDISAAKEEIYGWWMTTGSFGRFTEFAHWQQRN